MKDKNIISPMIYLYYLEQISTTWMPLQIISSLII